MIWTEDLMTISNNCSGVGCKVLKYNDPIVTGDGVISSKVILRRECGYEQWKINTIEIIVKPTVSTTYEVSWASKWMQSEDQGCNSPEHIIEAYNYKGSFEINTSVKFKLLFCRSSGIGYKCVVFFCNSDLKLSLKKFFL